MLRLQTVSPMEDDFKWKSSSKIKIEISQQLLVGSSPNFKLRLMCKENFTKVSNEEDLQWKKTSK
jgi:hypothetical protein